MPHIILLRPTQSVALLRCWYFKAYLKSNGTTQNKKYLAKCKLLNQSADLHLCFSYLIKKESIKTNFKTWAESAKTQMKDEKQNENEWAPCNVPIFILHSGVSQNRLKSNKFNYRTWMRCWANPVMSWIFLHQIKKNAILECFLHESLL